MLRIGSSFSGLSGFQVRMINQWHRIQDAIDQSSLRLTTNRRVNSTADDPAGVVAIAKMRAELTAVQQTSANIEAAAAVTDSADATLAEVIEHLNTIRTNALATTDVNLRQDEIDAAVQAINALSGTAFNGARLLDGSQSSHVSGRNAAQVDQITVVENNVNASQAVNMTVTTAGQKAQLTYAGDPGSLVKQNATIVLTGNLGSASVSVTQNENLTAARDRINAESQNTGVVASVSGNDLLLTSSRYGSDASVAVEVTSGTFAVTGGNGNGTANGVDAVATINGTTVTADGLKFHYRSSVLKFDLELASSFATGAVDAMTVSPGGMTFQISPTLGQSVGLNLPSVHAANLGGVAGRLSEVAGGGTKSLLTADAATVVNIVDDALSQVTSLRGRVGAMDAITLDSAAAVMDALEENLTEAIASIEAADAAEETTLLTQNQLLAENASAALYLSANREASLLPLLEALAFA
jgi:flagellin